MDKKNFLEILPDTIIKPIAGKFSGNDLTLLYVSSIFPFGERAILLESPEWQPFGGWGWTYVGVIEPAVMKHGYVLMSDAKFFAFKDRKEEIKKIKIQ